MTSRVLRSLVAAAVCAVAVWAPAAEAQSGSGSVRLLDVPYLAQTELLCGGAAAAMVMRFWGATDIYPQSFSSLVDRAAGGIHGRDLIDALHTRGWQATAVRGDAGFVRSHLEKGRPLIALIQDRPRTFHYVVVVAWRNGRVVLHDPARGPFRVSEERAFLAAWSASNNWTMLVLPPSHPSTGVNPASSDAEVSRAAAETSPLCASMIADAVRLANAGAVGEARTILEKATSSCPASADAWRELAGVHALQRHWKAAADDARQALARDARDEHATRILATSLYLEDRRDEALAVWNTLGEPEIDLVNISGLEHTRYDVTSRAMGLQRRRTLSVAELRRARRRLAAVPAVMTSRVSFTPAEDGRAQLDAAVIERPRMPTGALFLASAGARAAIDREAAWTVTNLSGEGEAFSVAWRWWENRPRIGFRFSAPSPARVGGVWTVDAFDERQTYGAAGLIERRRGVSLRTTDWLTGSLRWEAGLGVDDWDARGTSLSVSAGVEHHLLADRLVLALRGSLLAHDVEAVAAAARAQWRSAVRNEGQVWILESGVDLVSRRAPLALWSGAGTGQGRDVLLRAHPLLSDGVITGGMFGRELMHANVEWRTWNQWRAKPLRIAPAIFVDAAQANQRGFGLPDRTEVDAGAGARVAIPGGGVVRLDLARGLRDGATALSIGWTR